MSTVRTSLTLPKEVHEQMRLVALRQKKSLGQLVVELMKLNESLQQHQRRTKLAELADKVVGTVSKEESGWKDVNDVGKWQKQQRETEDGHRG